MWDGLHGMLRKRAYFHNFFEVIGGEGVRQL